MIQENELVTLIIALGVLLFFMIGRSRLSEFPAWKLFAGAYCVYLGGWIFTILEGLWGGTSVEPLMKSVFNALEHLCYAVSSLLFTLWCWKSFGGGKKVQS